MLLGSLPSSTFIRDSRPVHHSLLDGDSRHFVRAYAEVTVASVVLQPETAVADFEEALRLCKTYRRPVYIGIPADLTEVDLEPLPERNPAISSDPAVRAELRSALVQLFSQARLPVILTGHEVQRFAASAAVDALAATGIPLFATISGKGAVNETAANWLGIYHGDASDPLPKSMVESSDALILIGSPLSDSETVGFTANLPLRTAVNIRPSSTSVSGVLFPGIAMPEAIALVTAVAEDLRFTPAPRPAATSPTATFPAVTSPAPDATPSSEDPGQLVQSELWPAVIDSLRSEDILVADQGTATWGILDLPLPSGVTYVAETLWGAIGYSLPAALGASIASPGRRVVLLIGDGSVQLTTQEISTMARHACNITIVLIKNQGYTIERAINGAHARYNDIAEWDYAEVFKGLTHGAVRNVDIESVGQLKEELGSADNDLKVLQVRTAMMDLPHRLARFTETMREEK